MTKWEALRERYLRDPLPVRLGGLAANLARMGSFSDNPAHARVVAGMIEESKWFIEWTAPEAAPETQALLAEYQRQLARWHLAWDRIWRDAERRKEVAEQARLWSRRLLEESGLLGDTHQGDAGQGGPTA